MSEDNKPYLTIDSHVFIDIDRFQRYFGVDKHEMTDQRLLGQIEFLEEELAELRAAYTEGNAHETVDGLIDLIVVAAGTLKMVRANSMLAWSNVMEANMRKAPGTNAKRPNSGGVDLIKPEGWRPPDLTAACKQLDEMYKRWRGNEHTSESGPDSE